MKEVILVVYFPQMTTEDFNFLEEKPLQTAEELSASKFGHGEIAQTLARIIKKCPAPFTIGLFAKWGSGKSTVANSLKKELPKEKIPVIIFDVWKHEGDALRRTFLKEMVQQLKDFGSDFFDTSFTLNEKLEQSVSRSAESKIRFKKEMFEQLYPYFIIGCFLLGIGAWVCSHFGILDLFIKTFLSFFGFATGGAFLLWILNQSVNLFSTETVSYGVDKFEDPHQFEEEFSSILCALKNKRILIVFDNLDRVVHDKVAEVLSTVKTFLEPRGIADKSKEVVFLVPCDARAIKQHLSNIYGDSQKYTFDPDEFLRKFFNSIIWIPDFIPSELESFARTSLQRTKIQILDNDYVAWIITKAFRDNPRQIIQFVNILLANYLLVEEREGENKDFPQGFLKENIPQLTKYLVLNQLFPDEMEKIREQKVLDLNDVTEKDLDTDKKKDFLAFVDQTRNIPINNLRIFFTLRRSAQEKRFPGFDSFIALLEDRKIEESKKYFSQLGDFTQPDLINDFGQAIKTELESKTNPVSSVNLIHSLFSILTEKNISLDGSLYEEINNILKGRSQAQLHTIPAPLLNQALLVKNVSYRKAIVSQWITVVADVAGGNTKYKSDRTFMEGVFLVFAEFPDYLDATQKTTIKPILSGNLSNDLSIAKTIIASTDAQQKLLDSDYVRNFTIAIPNGGNIDDITARLDTLNNITPALLAGGGADSILTKFNELQGVENTNTTADALTRKQKLLSQFRKFFAKQITLVSKMTEPVRDTFTASLIAGFNSVPDNEQRSIFIPMFYEWRKHASAQKVTEIDAHISGYLASISPTKLEETFQDLSEKDRGEFFDASFYTQAGNRAISDDNFRNVLFTKLSDTRKKEFITQILNSDFDRALTFMESLDKKETKHVWAIFDKVWQKFDAGSVPQKQRVFSFVNSRQAGTSAQIREILTARIITTLTTSDHSLQKIGSEATLEANSHIADQKRRMIAKDVFDWLKKPEVPRYQPFAFMALISEVDQLNEEEQKELMQFVFDEIVRKDNDTSHLGVAFDLLKSLKPKYEERKQNYDDVRAKIESESNEDLKKSLVSGLFSLTPERTNQHNKEFWSWVENLANPPKEDK